MDYAATAPDLPATAQVAREALTAHLREICALEGVRTVLSWDQETMMPPNGAAARAEHNAAIARATHRLHADPRMGEWIAILEAEDASLDPITRTNSREARRIHDRATRVPASLASDIARAATLGQVTWAAARQDRCFADLAPALTQIVDLKRNEARCFAGSEASPDALYDALLDTFEPGAKVAQVVPLLDSLRPTLIALRERIAERVAHQGNAPDAAPMEEAAQLALAQRLCAISGYGAASGRLDRSAHPFSLALGPGDVRITTRVGREAPWECLYATMHELGHALYALGIDPALAFTPAGRSASMGFDESQSRLWENQIGRSRAFCTWLGPEVGRAGGGPSDPDHLYSAVNRVAPGFIRTEADEVHYNLHILLRLGLERELIAGDLDVADLEAAWNAQFERDFGVTPPDAAQGVLQDVHWAVGLFGYFPTYSLGNIYGAAISAAMRAALPDLDADLARGELASAAAWLRKNIHRHGRLKTPAQIVEDVTGAPMSTGPLVAHLERKYSELYRL